MRTTLGALALAIFVNITAYGQINDWVFVSTPLKWKSPPRRAEAHIHTAPATVIVLYPEGRYAAVGCVLIEQKDGTVTISHGDGYVVRSGTWKTVDDRLLADAIVVFRTLRLVSKEEPTSSQTEQFKVIQMRGHKELEEAGGQKYAPLTRFADFDGLATLVNTTAIPKPADW